MELYRDEDIQAITDSLDKIVEETTIIKNHELEPTFDDYCQAIQVCREFIKSKKRIIYGGAAYNKLIIQKKEEDRIYKKYDRKDIEFYTFEPISDLVELCNILQEKKFPFVQGRQAQHEGTYSIFVNFEGICDMSYMPKNIYSNMPVISIEKILYSHPMWILVDIFRQYNDPITSYWRLKDKTFFRASTLLKHYPLELNTSSSFSYPNKFAAQKLKLFNIVSEMKTIIFTGSVAETYYLTLKSQLNVTHMEVFSTCFKLDIRVIQKHIEEILGKDYSRISIKVYRPFFQYWDERIEFFLDNECIIKIFGNNGICLPYNNIYVADDKINKIQVGGYYKKQVAGKSDEKCVKIATFILLLNHMLIHRQYEYINRSEDYKKYEKIMHDLLSKRNQYLKKEVKTVMDNTPYREFIIRCNGVAVDNNRRYRLQLVNKKLKGKVLSFNYNPETQKDKFILPDYQFSNISGNINEHGLDKLLTNKQQIN